MRFQQFDKVMRKFEESLDQIIPEDVNLVVRLDGKGFTKLTSNFEKPFDFRFRNLMVNTTKSVMKDSGFKILYGYTQSDEISLLFHPDDNTFGRKVRKINTTLASEASVAFSMGLGIPATFDCRVVPLPTVEDVCDYFLWRQEDAGRNCLNGWCYWTLRKSGLSKRAATSMMNKKGNEYKKDLLLQYGVDTDTFPLWQKRGIGLIYDNVECFGIDPRSGEKVKTLRRKINVNDGLSNSKAYSDMIRNALIAAMNSRK